MTPESKTWEHVKEEYLQKVAKALSSVKHPRSSEVLEDVRSHLDKRFAELESQQQTWENFQAIITEMGPASDYAELLDPDAARPSKAVWQKKLPLISLAAVVVIALAVLLTIPGETLPGNLNEEQQLYMDWTETTFASFLDQDEYRNLTDSARNKLEEKWLNALQGPRSGEYYRAINCLATIESKKAVKPLLRIATEQREKENRDRWMATRALGILADKSIAPQLIHLLYHYNQNTRFWAQISLVRLTGVNFGPDWQAWGRWWTDENGGPPFSSQKIEWTTRTASASEVLQRQKDKAFIERLRQQTCGIDKTSVETYIVNFKPVSPFEPQTSGDLLNAFNERHPRGVRTHHYRTEVHDNALVGYICVDTKAGKDAVLNMLGQSDKLQLVEAALATARDLETLYKMGQPSLKSGTVASVPVNLEKLWNCTPMLDPATRASLAGFESYYQQKYHIETGYESASEAEKSAMIEQWTRVIQSRDYDQAVRAAASLGDVEPGEEIAVLLAKVATAPKGSNRVKWLAVRGLAKMAQPQTVPDLISLLDHHNANIRAYAKVALAEISSKFFGDDKEKWRNWWQQYQEKQEQVREKKPGLS